MPRAMITDEQVTLLRRKWFGWSRLLAFPEFVMTTGAAFPVDPDLVEQVVAMLRDDTMTRIREVVAEDKSSLTAAIILRSLAPEEDPYG